MDVLRFQRLAVLCSEQHAEDMKNQASLSALAAHAPQDLAKVFKDVGKSIGTDVDEETSGYDPPEGKKGIGDFLRKHGKGL